MKIEYHNYIGTIKGLAYRYSQTTGISAQELISAGNEYFVVIQKDFDPEKSCFNTYLNLKLRSLFLNMGAKRKRQSKIELQSFEINEHENIPNTKNYSKIENINEILDSLNPEKRCIFADVISALPHDAKKVIEVIFNTPAEVLDMIPKKQPRSINKFILTKYFKGMDWGISRILEAFDDIKSILN